MSGLKRGGMVTGKADEPVDLAKQFGNGSYIVVIYDKLFGI